MPGLKTHGQAGIVSVDSEQIVCGRTNAWTGFLTRLIMPEMELLQAGRSGFSGPPEKVIHRFPNN
jgi:hypothetical protein